MIVEDVMSTGLLTATRDDDVRSVVEKMVTRHCGAVPVIDEGEQLIGIIAIRDIILPLYPNCGEYIHDEIHTHYFSEMEEAYPTVLNKRVEEIMTANPLSVLATDPILKAASFMGVKNIRRMPVVSDNGKLVGMVSIGDINRALFMAYVNQTIPLKAVAG